METEWYFLSDQWRRRRRRNLRRQLTRQDLPLERLNKEGVKRPKADREENAYHQRPLLCRGSRNSLAGVPLVRVPTK